MNTCNKGHIGEIAAITKLSSLGFNISLPIDKASRYDLIAEKNGICYRIQVKTQFVKAAVVKVKAASVISNTKYLPYTKKDIDIILVYYVPESRWFWINIEYMNAINRQSLYLRITKAKSNRQKDINYAEDFEIKALVP